MENSLREDLKTIFLAGVRKVDPEHIILSQMNLRGDLLEIASSRGTVSLDLSRYDRILVLGAGKASARMARALETVLGDRIDRGVVAVKYGHTEKLERIRLVEAGHPVPDENSLRAAEEAAALAEEAGEKTLVFNLISGGGSALLCLPYRDADLRLSLEEKQATTKLLLECGADIREINTLRKHISGIKGGRLAEKIHPGRCVSLILSDVVGDDLDAIASGMTVPDGTTFAAARAVADKYRIWEKLPEKVRRIIEGGLAGKIPETPKAGDRIFSRVETLIIGSNAAALGAAEEAARELGYRTLVLGSRITGEAREIAKVFSGMAQEMVLSGRPLGTPACVLAGGETTVTIRGTGKGGRNQEMALAFLREMEPFPENWENLVFLSAGTDGNDGPTDAAGAFAWQGALSRAADQGLDLRTALNNNDAYNFFRPLDGLLITGPTNTNVCDIQIILHGDPSKKL